MATREQLIDIAESDLQAAAGNLDQMVEYARSRMGPGKPGMPTADVLALTQTQIMYATACLDLARMK